MTSSSLRQCNSAEFFLIHSAKKSHKIYLFGLCYKDVFFLKILLLLIHLAKKSHKIYLFGLCYKDVSFLKILLLLIHSAKNKKGP